jgi:hypothetical protein
LAAQSDARLHSLLSVLVEVVYTSVYRYSPRRHVCVYAQHPFVVQVEATDARKHLEQSVTLDGSCAQAL